MRWSTITGGAAATLVAAVLVPGPALAAPGDPCPAPTPVDGTIDVDTVDQPLVVADRNHLAGRVGTVTIDYLSPPGEPLDSSVAAMRAHAGLGSAAQVTTSVLERSVLVSLRTTTSVVGCVNDGAAGFVEVALSDVRLSFTGDPVADPDGVVVTSGYLAVTITRHRTERPVVEVVVTGTVPSAPAGQPAGDPVGARPTFVG